SELPAMQSIEPNFLGRLAAVAAALLVAAAPASAGHSHSSSSVPVTAPSAAALARMSADLRPLALPGASVPAGVAWAKLQSGEILVKVLVVAASSAPDLASLRADIVARGGSVHYNYLSVRALAAMVPASALGALAARADVLAIAPNRQALRQASLLQDA